jgi:uncharacterized membrane protein YdbT with pleckstrin-like domain
MSYVQDNLMPNEQILFTARIHPAIFLSAAITFFFSLAVMVFALTLARRWGGLPSTVVLLMAGVFFLYSIGLGLQAVMAVLTTEFAVTNRRIVAKTGFIRRQTLEMLLAKVESIAVAQNITGRLLNFGTVTVTGTGGTKESFMAISDPIGVRKQINQILENTPGLPAATGQFKF